MSHGTYELKGRLRRAAGACFSLSLLLVLIVIFWPSLLGPVFFSRGNERVATAVQLSHLLLWVLGCGLYAKSKGYSGILGIAGTLCLVGLLILRLLPDRWKAALEKAPQGGPSDLTNYPR